MEFFGIFKFSEKYFKKSIDILPKIQYNPKCKEKFYRKVSEKRKKKNKKSLDNSQNSWYNKDTIKRKEKKK